MLLSEDLSLVGERALDGLWHGRGDGQMGGCGLETVLIGDVVDAVLLAIISDVLVESAGAEGGVLASDVVDLALLLSQDLVLGLVQVVVSIDLVVLDVTDNSPATLSLAVDGLRLDLLVHGLRNMHGHHLGDHLVGSSVSAETSSAAG